MLSNFSSVRGLPAPDIGLLRFDFGVSLCYIYAIMVSSIINLLYPPLCLVCGRRDELRDQVLCTTCLRKLKKRLPPFCVRCGRQLPGDPRIKASCDDCKKDTLYFDRAFSVFYYNGILKDLVHNFKYKKMTSLAQEFARLAVDFIKDHGIAKNTDMVLSIPMHSKRLFKREINPSHILAKAIAKKLRLDYSGRLLKKTKNTAAQSRLSRSERIENLKGSFSLRKNTRACVKNKKILIVDDLFTTGSTVNECARLLKEANADYVEVVTLARGDRVR